MMNEARSDEDSSPPMISLSSSARGSISTSTMSEPSCSFTDDSHQESDADPKVTHAVLDMNKISTADVTADEDNLVSELGVRVYHQHALESGIHSQLSAAVADAERRRKRRIVDKHAKQIQKQIQQVEMQLSRSEQLHQTPPRSMRQLLSSHQAARSCEQLRLELRQLKSQLNNLKDSESKNHMACISDMVLPAGCTVSAPNLPDSDSEPPPPGADRDFGDITHDTEDGSHDVSNATSLSARNTSQSQRSVRDDNQSESSYSPSSDEKDQSDNETKAGLPSLIKQRSSAKPSKSDSTKEVGGRERDDGDYRLYKLRLKHWWSTNTEWQDQTTVDVDGLTCPASLWNKLYRYQRSGVRWMWELHQQRCGGILADEMGLGKTIQLIVFLAALWNSKKRERCGGVLIVAPATVLQQWVHEFHRWWPQQRVALFHETGTYSGKRSMLAHQISSCGGVLITSYSAVTSEADMLSRLAWRYVILDEGHKIRNPDAKVTLAVKKFGTVHRLILSGSPLQNSLRELWSLLDFVFPGRLGTLPVFLSQFAVPITQAGYANASKLQVETGYRCAKVLRDTIAPYMLRRMKADVRQAIQLPNKNEQVLFCKLTQHQRDLYMDYITSDKIKTILSGKMKVFVGLIALRKLCNHPDLFDPGRAVTPTCAEGSGDDEDDPTVLDSTRSRGHWKLSGKMMVVASLLKMWNQQGHKVLIFTQSRQMLNLLEMFVKSEEYQYVRMDGSTSVSSRNTTVSRFNSDPELFVFLLTTRVGGLGLNLTSASRVVIYDPDWNPSTDMQARERAWRIGQKNSVTIYRLLCAGTIEEKIYHRQIFKQFLTNRVLKDPKQQRFFKTTDLYDLFSLTDCEGQTGSVDSRDKVQSGQEQPAATETAELFSDSQVDLDEVNRRVEAKQREQKLKQREQKLKQRKQKSEHCEQKLNESEIDDNERRQRHLRLMAQRLNRKLFSDSASVHSPANGDSSTHSAGFNSDDSRLDSALGNESPEKRPNFDKVRNRESELFSATTTSLKQTSSIDPHISPTLSQTDNRHSYSKPLAETSTTSSANKRRRRRRDSESDAEVGCQSSSSRSRRKRRRLRLVEGRQVDGVVSVAQFKAANAAENDDGDTEDTTGCQDDYVLAKLFRKSKVQSALKHEAIEEQSCSVEQQMTNREAEKVAREAVTALRLSRQQVAESCRSRGGVPLTWTGSHGSAGRPTARPRFGQKTAASIVTKPPPPPPTVSTPPPVRQSPLFQPDRVVVVVPGAAGLEDPPAAGSSADLLSRIRARNADSSELASSEHERVLAELCQFLRSGTEMVSRASTDQLLTLFNSFNSSSSGSCQERRQPVDRQLFRALLRQVCDFRRSPGDNGGVGYWYLKPELI